ncbi:MAG: hypothetical protein IJ309_06895 [Clostridia bacterium]|nr:hypothetical protein [Clostridia bacterium]
MAQWQENNLNQVTHLWELYERGLDYQASIGLRESIPTFVSFFEGKQWPQPTPSTKNLPRPVVNIVKMICRSKKSAVLSTPVRIFYKSLSPFTDIDKLNDFASCLFKELDQEEIDRRAIDDGVKKGSYFYHYYWDPSAPSLSSSELGGVRCELIDPLNIFFSCPEELNEQKQDWILISTRKTVEEIKSIADEDIALDFLEPDTRVSAYGTKESATEKKITLLTRYFRQNGEVFCERATKSAIISRPFSLTPDFTELSQLDNTVKKTVKKQVATLYPVVCGYYEKREGTIYGLGEVEGLIPNQKAINFNIAMSLLNAQECAWGKYIALPNALKGQKISNSPGQVLIDYSGTGEGIKRMPDVGLSQVPMAITTDITELTRMVAGTTEVFTGDSFNSNLSGSAIAYLQAQAQMPIEELKNNFYIAKKKQGMVLAQFMRLYYYKRAFIRTKSGESGKSEEYFDTFLSLEYENSSLEVIVEAVGGTKSSIAQDISFLDTCLKNGYISLETYINAYPDSAITNKSALLRQIEKEKSSEISTLKAEIESLKSKLEAKD